MVYYCAMKVKVLKLEKDATLPAYAHPHDAGMDIFALETTTVAPSEFVAVRTGISMEIPKGHVGLVWDKSGLALKGIKTIAGVVDAGYRGEVKICVTNLGKTSYTFEKGHKVAQMLIQKVESPTIAEVKKLSETKRGKKGFGSTGR